VTKLPRRPFTTLDGLRGVAAVLVVPRHVGEIAGGVSFPESFLAVDLFFLLSGFVIAYAYDERLARGDNILRFLGIRLIRLYPLYLLGIMTGLLYRVGSAYAGTPGWTAARIGEALLLGVLMIPKSPYTSVGSSALDGPTWTLLPELVANLVYAAFHRLLNRMALVVIVALGAAGMVWSRLMFGTLDAGWDPDHWPVAAARLTFSFFGGALVFRLLGDRRRLRPWTAWTCLAIAAVALAATPPEPLQAAYELVLVLALFPTVLCVACLSEPGPRAAALFRFLGLISYAVYVLHEPAGALVGRALQRGARLNLEDPWTANIALVGFLALLVAGTWLVDRYYDTPVRRWLGRRWSRLGRTEPDTATPIRRVEARPSQVRP
jgi:peptidoglycan/LPS O-acetylase OafA/YrhL